MSDTSNHYLGKGDKKNPLDEMLRSMKDGMIAIFWAIVICLIVGLLLSCRSHSYGVVDTMWIHDTIHHDVTHRDSIYLHDSVYFETHLKGDTVYVTHDRWHTKYKDRLLHDSIYIHKTDTIIKSLEVEKKLSPWNRLQQWMGSVFLLILAALSILATIDFFSRRR